MTDLANAMDSNSADYDTARATEIILLLISPLTLSPACSSSDVSDLNSAKDAAKSNADSVVATQANLISAKTDELNALVLEIQALNEQISAAGGTTIDPGTTAPTVATVTMANDDITASGTTGLASMETTRMTGSSRGPTGSMPTGSTFDGSLPTGSTFDGSVPTGSTFNGLMSTGSTFDATMPTGSTFDASMPTGSTFDGSLPTGSTFEASMPTGSTFDASMPTGSTFDGS